MTRTMTVRLLVVQLAAALLFAGLLAVPGLRRAEARAVAMDNWQVDDLMAHLRANGLQLRAVPTFEIAPINNGAFLTTTDDPWSRLNSLNTGTERIETWKGTVSCHRLHQGSAGQVYLNLWGDNASCVGPFVLFGDPELRARILAALAS